VCDSKSMVNLNNPYPPVRPRPAAFVPLLLLFALGYPVFHCAVFSFLYRYTLAMALLVFTASLFDRELLSKKRLLSLPGRKNGWAALLGTAAALTALLYGSTKLSSGATLVLDFYRPGPVISGAEQMALVLILIVPLEEVFFRAYGQLNFMNLLGRNAGLVLSSALYGLFFFFGGGWVLALKFTALNLCLGLVYARTGSLSAAIAFRMALGLLIMLIPL